jgi:hypothetical protein
MRHFEASAFYEQRREVRRRAAQVNGCLFFWFVFFGQAKKMNIKEINIKTY